MHLLAIKGFGNEEEVARGAVYWAKKKGIHPLNLKVQVIKTVEDNSSVEESFKLFHGGRVLRIDLELA
jgi:hypothetical protein